MGYVNGDPNTAQPTTFSQFFRYPYASPSDIALRVLGGFTLGLLVVCSLCLWPYLFSALGQENAAMATRLVTGGGIAFALSTIAAVLVGWYDNDYTLVKSIAVTSIICLIVNYLAMLIGQVDLLNAIGLSFGGTMLSLVVNALLGLMMSLLPALIAGLIGFTVRAVWWLFHCYFRRR